MKTRTFALVMGIVFLAVGILGFVPRLVTMPPDQPHLMVEAAHGNLFGLFPVNAVHNLLHLVFGVWGVVVWRSFAASRAYAASVAVIYAIVTVLGLIPATNTLFGLAPVHGNDIWLHALLAVAGAVFGFVPVATIEGNPTVARRP